MVLADLSKSLTAALKKLSQSPSIDDACIDECLKDIGRALVQADVNIKIISEIRKFIKAEIQSQPTNNPMTDSQKIKFIQKSVHKGLVKMLSPQKEPYNPIKGTPNVIMFVGLQGSGKTTTCTKYACYYRKKGFKVALICADTFRAGAYEQLKQNCLKVRIPFYGNTNESDPVKIAKEGVKLFSDSHYDIIIVDTSGRHKQEASLFDEMIQIRAAVNPQEIIFIMDSHIGQACAAQAEAFSSAVSIGSVIVTKLDSHAAGGGALSAVAATGAPISFIGLGEHFDQFERFNPQGFASRLLGLGDLGTLFTTFAENVSKEEQQDMFSKMVKGEFTFRMLSNQIKMVSKLGPLDKLVEMIPGMGGEALDAIKGMGGSNDMKKILCIFDSMTNDEMDCVVPLTDSRILRVARGCGAAPEQIKAIVDQRKQLAKTFAGVGKNKGMGNVFAKMKAPGGVNPFAAMAGGGGGANPFAGMGMPGIGGGLESLMGGMDTGMLSNMMSGLMGGGGGKMGGMDFQKMLKSNPKMKQMMNMFGKM